MKFQERDNQFMIRAIELSRAHMQNNDGGPFGAVITQNGKIISEGWNRVTSTNDPTAHAEVTAIRMACADLHVFDLTGCELYTSCEPCPMCLSAIYWARISRIYYACTLQDAANIRFDDDFIYREIPKPIAARSIPMQQLSHDAALAVFKEWELKPDKIRY